MVWTRAVAGVPALAMLLAASQAALAADAGKVEVRTFNADSYREKGELTFTVDVKDDSGPVDALDKAQWMLGVGEPNAELTAVAPQTFRASGGITSVLVVLSATGSMMGQDESDTTAKDRKQPPMHYALEGLAALKPALAKQDKITVGCYDEATLGADKLVKMQGAGSANLAKTVEDVRSACHPDEGGGEPPRLKTVLSNVISDWLVRNKEVDRCVVVIVTDGNSKEAIDGDWWRPLQAKAGRAWLELYVVGLADAAFDPAKLEALAKGGVLRRAEKRTNLPDEIGALAPLVAGAGLYRVQYTVADSIKGPDVSLVLAAKDARGLFRSDPVPMGQLQRKSSWLRVVILVAAILVGAAFLVLLIRYLVAAAAERRRRREEEAAAAANQQYDGPARGRLIVRDGPAKNQSFPLIDDLTYVGRSAENHVVIPDKTVSKRHMSIRIHDRTYQLEDLQSVAGVYVNGQKVVKVHLKDGDSIRMGSTEMQFRLA
ncbi:MAG: FHA domain-containing protein [Deltaproteobacteria bacterium]|nr:FHA domain-containing protein [Deltaproteobacteria bacterium]